MSIVGRQGVQLGGLLLLLGGAAPIALAQDMRLAGCYDVSTAPWAADSGPAAFRFQSRVNLTGVVSARDPSSRSVFLFRAAPGAIESAYEDTTWSMDTKGHLVFLQWATPFFGYSAWLKVRRNPDGSVDEMRGEISSWSHSADAERVSTEMVLRKVGCFAPLGRP